MGNLDDGTNSSPENSTVSQAAGDRGSSPLVSVSWRAQDSHWWLTALALMAIVAALALFGVPPVDLHGPLRRLGIMDPPCGGTRATRYTAHGQLVEALRHNGSESSRAPESTRRYFTSPQTQPRDLGPASRLLHRWCWAPFRSKNSRAAGGGASRATT